MRIRRFGLLVAACMLAMACSTVNDIDFDYGVVNATTDPIKVLVNTQEVGVVGVSASVDGSISLSVHDSGSQCCGTQPSANRRTTATFVAINLATQQTCTKTGVELQKDIRTTVVFDYSCQWRPN
jgi:hypothetical protein